jgi:hypothetical protein
MRNLTPILVSPAPAISKAFLEASSYGSFQNKGLQLQNSSVLDVNNIFSQMTLSANLTLDASSGSRNVFPVLERCIHQG